MDAIESNRVNTFGAAVVLACIGFLAACSEAPQEPGPVFALPVSQVVGAPKIEGEASAPARTPPNIHQLRYIAVPPGQKVAGMARAHLILKPTQRHHAHAHKTRHAGVRPVSTQRPPAKPAAEEPSDKPNATQ